MITITAASSQFGRAVLDELLADGAAPESIVATARETTSLASYADRGVQVRFADYEDTGSLDAAFRDLDRLLLISSNSPAAQAAQHANVVEAAKRANATEIVYTSYLNADTSGIQMAQPHAETERIIRESGLPFAFLRNGSYIENSAGFVGFWVQYGEAVGAAGDGKISGAARQDLAIAAARVIAGDVVNGEVYELGGSDYTMQDLVTVAAELSGKPITYNNLPKDAYAGVLVSGGLPEGLAAAIADNNAGAARGAWKTTSTALTDILGRPTTTPREVFAQALAQLN
ncbi:NAD(P)-dependent oxidoreductase [Paenarthrobacter nitroguajacolicus]|uniref:NAD(P)H-binding protein n=1 Tax=Paenarthrobacter nitroguajacolicus TaxID=211146 RepID=UPI0015BDF495|nr:NAD(P)H-binding protein [Paenarthrobacter nitroguajacolicus]NWL10425.1 NAD(P)-dependent oxidoreductase [Paenarthrobacter nitroguajacolicus]